jgi:ParB-like chromosome segregation protein Spo0J
MMTDQHMDKLIFVNHTQLSRHANNMRRDYPTSALRKMGLSQQERAKSGQACCVQPLVVTAGAGIEYDPAQHHAFVIVAGHLRHAGNAWLGEDAPPLPCIVRFYLNEAEMLADMGTENGVREDVGAISWSIYLKQQIDAGVKMHELLKRTGLTLGRALLLIDLAGMPELVQGVFDRGELPLGALRPLRLVSDANQLAELAIKLGQKHATLQQVEMAVKALNGTKKAKPASASRKPVADVPALIDAPDGIQATLSDVRKGAAKACEACEVGGDLPLDEPAWRIAVESVTNTCKACDLKVFERVCKACPLAEAMRNIVKAAKAVQA